MNSIDVKPNTYFDFDKENNKKDPKIEVGDYVRMLKHKHILAKV